MYAGVSAQAAGLMLVLAGVHGNREGPAAPADMDVGLLTFEEFKPYSNSAGTNVVLGTSLGGRGVDTFRAAGGVDNWAEDDDLNQNVMLFRNGIVDCLRQTKFAGLAGDPVEWPWQLVRPGNFVWGMRA